MKTLHLIIFIMSLLITQKITAQTDYFVMGDDEINVQSSWLNKKGKRQSFTTSENIYLKSVLPNPIKSYIQSKGDQLTIQITELDTGKDYYVYPHFQDDRMADDVFTVGLRSKNIHDKNIQNLTAQFENILQKAKFQKGEIRISLVSKDQNGKIKQTISQRKIIIK